MKFLVAFKKADATLLKVRTDESKEVWIGCSDEVFNYAKKSFKPEDDIVLTTEKKAGKDFITRVARPGGAKVEPKPVEATTAATAPTNNVTETKAEPVKAPYKPYEKKTYGKSPEEQDKITRQCAMKSAVEFVSRIHAGKGSNDPSLVAQVEEVYARLLKLITE